MREDLLGYLLDATGPDEAREIERRIDADARWRSEAARLRALLGLDQEESGAKYARIDPPPGLAARTCEFIHQLRAETAARSLHAALVPQT